MKYFFCCNLYYQSDHVKTRVHAVYKKKYTNQYLREGKIKIKIK